MRTRYLLHFIGLLTISAFLVSCSQKDSASVNDTTDQPDEILFKNATVITGISENALTNTDVLVRKGVICEIGENLSAPNAKVIDLSGKTLMPALISAHVHVGNLKGTESHGSNFTQENVLRHLKRYQDYGILHVLSLGTDRKILFEDGFYQRIQQDNEPGARMFSAGWGFGVKDGAPPFEEHDGNDNVFRPQNTEIVSHHLDSLNRYDIGWVKIWLDDFGDDDIDKMDPPIYQTIIQEAHKRNMQTAAHLYYLEDAKRMANANVNNFAHSIRDREVDSEIIDLMISKNISYIPTVTLDEFEFAYADGAPSWFEDAFFKNSLEDGAYQKMQSAEFREDQRDENLQRKRNALQNALTNVKKLYDAGVLVGFGTDSGAQIQRSMGFSEHRELELLVQAGLLPWQALQTATINSARIMGIDKEYGSIETGKKADLLILSANPLENISNTQKIESVYKAGVMVSQGPIQK
ncbi:MAG: amidohydrolase family protein [Weeksellaceae bacterium]|nr:amidohydrolase family protein [Weeksellaceae bacterium]